MSEADGSNEDRTEEATPERRDEFREKGQIAISKDLASTVSLGVLIALLWQSGNSIFKEIMSYTARTWRFDKGSLPDISNIGLIMAQLNYSILVSLIPVLSLVCLAAMFAVFAQTRFNFSWQRVNFDWSRLNPVTGISRIISIQSAIELFKSVLKLFVVALITYLVLHAAWKNLPLLMVVPVEKTLMYWGNLTRDLFYTVIALLVAIAAGDYVYQYLSVEKKLMMTKEEVKQEYKQREQDPHIKQRMKRMQRDNITRSKIARTKTATVIVTNPTHYSIALKYEQNYVAPILVAKGVDDVALRMRIVAQEEKIPIVENRILARSLYAQVEEGDEIPSKFYAAVAEVIRYVYKIKGKRIRKKIQN